MTPSSHPPEIIGAGGRFKDSNQRIISSSSMLSQLERRRKEKRRS